MFKSAEYIQRHTHALTTEHYIVALIAPEFLLRMKRETLWCVRNICVLCVHCTHAHTQFKQVRNNVSVRMPPHKYCHRHKTKSNVNICTLKSAGKKTSRDRLVLQKLEHWRRTLVLLLLILFVLFCSAHGKFVRCVSVCVRAIGISDRQVVHLPQSTFLHCVSAYNSFFTFNEIPHNSVIIEFLLYLRSLSFSVHSFRVCRISPLKFACFFVRFQRSHVDFLSKNGFNLTILST